MSTTPSSADAFARFKAGLEASPGTTRFRDADLEAVYAVAYSEYRQGHYAKAASTFSWLTLYRPTNPRFLKGLGSAQLRQRAFEASAGTFAFLVMLNPEDAESLCLWGHALLLAGDKTQARVTLVRAAELAARGDACTVGQRAKALLALSEG